MKFEQFSQPQKLDEVRLGQSDLDQFVNSDEAQGIKAGFEAELCFRDIGGGDTDYDNPVEDTSNDTRPDSIGEICDFFHDGDYNGRREIQALREHLQGEYDEWRSEKMSEDWYEVREENVREYIEENDYDRDDEIKNYLTDHLDLDSEQVDAILDNGTSNDNPEARASYLEAADYANTQLDELVQSALDEENRSYDYAREEWEQNNDDNGEYDEESWLRDRGVRWMTDVPEEFSSRNVSITWPYYEYPDSEAGFNESSASELALSMRKDMDVEVKVGTGYHSVQRTATRWIIEADSSLDADAGDMPAEIVSPPMPLDVCLDKMDEFWAWAIGHDAYTNDSTGLHVGISLPHVDGRIDYVKLALFLGDKYVLEQFGRNGNYYCKSSFDKIKDSSQADRVSNAFDIMRKGLIELATKTLGQSKGHGKYSSIHLKDNYVEFRSMGGDDYLEQLPQIKNTVKRYAYAMYIASRPDLYRDEYAKKLYKLLDKSTDTDGVALFSKFISGSLSKVELKQELQNRNTNRQHRKSNTQAVGSQKWAIINTYSRNTVAAFMAPDERTASQKFGEWLVNHGRSSNDTLYKLERMTDSEENRSDISIPPATQARGGFTGYWKVIIDRTGEEVYRFNGVGNSQADANRVAAQWVRNSGLDDPVSVYPVMGNQ